MVKQFIVLRTIHTVLLTWQESCDIYKVKGKTIVLHQTEPVLALWALLRVEENPEGKTTKLWLWSEKDILHVA